jgi:hypothetical protein
MLQIVKLIELADLCFDLAGDASNPEAMKALQDIAISTCEKQAIFVAIKLLRPLIQPT